MQYPFDPVATAAAALISDCASDESLGIPLVAEHSQIAAFCGGLEASLARAALRQSVFIFVNEKEDATDDARESNLKTLAYFGMTVDSFVKSFERGRHRIFVVNGTLPPHRLRAKEGVGRARKILGDLALHFYKGGKISSPLHRQSDADVRLPADYFSAALPHGAVAGTYPFLHSRGDLSPAEYEGLLRYENFLRSYVEGIKRAGSPYAYWALGSTLLFDLRAYEKVRGFPNTRAGEDFYFLAKMTKVGAVRDLGADENAEIRLEISGRHSDRVPFGTGRALENLRKGKSYDAYPTRAFDDLKIVLSEIERLSEHRDVDRFYSQIGSENDFIVSDLARNFRSIMAQNLSAAQRLRQLHQTFDGLQTFRWIREKTARIRAQNSSE